MRMTRTPGRREAQNLFRQLATSPVTRRPRRIDKPLAIYGAGNLGKMALDFLARVGHLPSFVVDANASSLVNDPFWSDMVIVAPHEVPIADRATHLLAITVATQAYEDFARALSSQGWTDVVPFYDVSEAYRNIHPLGNGWVLDEIDEEDIDSTLQTLAEWSDDISRAHHLQFLAWHRTGTDWVFDNAPVDTQRRYFIPEVVSALAEEQAFMDVGAHHGETTARFCGMRGFNISNVWMVEPDPANATEAERSIARLATAQKSRVELIRCAVSNRSAPQRFFAGLGYASQLSPLGNELTEVRTIDDLDLRPTFIKLHLEGHELEALMGAESTLRDARPIIAATAYHNKHGLWRLPLWLMKLSLDYKYYFRLHSWCGTGAVVYCIPRESRLS
jgi:FkbM family methyltransferase